LKAKTAILAHVNRNGKCVMRSSRDDRFRVMLGSTGKDSSLRSAIIGKLVGIPPVSSVFRESDIRISSSGVSSASLIL